MKYMLKKKKDAELSITIIIVAILGLIVLVVMILIFSEGSGKSVGVLKSCEVRGGDCKYVVGGGCDSTEVPMSNAVCPDKFGKKRICCTRLE